jgi:hypothetical protein
MKNTFYYVNALAGSGKTHGAIQYALKMASSGEKVLIVQPTIKLIEESYQNAKNRNLLGMNISRIHSESVLNISTQSELMEYLKYPIPDVGEVLFVTHKTFFSLPYFHQKDNWIVIVDEVPNVIRLVDINLPDTHNLITGHIEAINENALYYLLKPKSGHEGYLQRIVKNKNNDEFYNLIRDLAELVNSPYWKVYIKKQNWRRILDGDTESGKIKLQAFGILQPKILFGIKEVVLMGAMFDESPLKRLWKTKDIEFDGNHEIKDSLLFDRHENSHLIEIKYFTDADWSKRNRDKTTTYDGQSGTYMGFYVDRIKQLLDKDEFIWSANKDIPDDIFLGMDGTRISGYPHGLNQYKHIHNVVFMSALNLTPPHIRFLETKYIDPANVKEAIAYQSAYQSIMRCSIRNPSNTDNKTIYVPDLGTANWLKKYFLDANLSKLDGIPEMPMSKKRGRKKTGFKLTNAEKKRLQRKREKLQNEILRFNKLQPSNNNCHSNSYSNSISSDISLFKSIKDTQSKEYTSGNFDHFVELFKVIHKKPRNSKEDNILFSPAIFEGTRNKSNVKSASILVLDIDKGDMKPSQFMGIFPHLRMLIINTYSGRNNYRAIIPVEGKLNYEAYVRIQKMIIHEIEDNGFIDSKSYSDKNSKKHGIDKSKIGPESIFYMPCPAKNPEDSFFIEQEGELLNPFEWIKTPILVQQDIDDFQANRAQTFKQSDSRFDTQNYQSTIDKYVAEYKYIPAGIKERNHGFFILGYKLYELGLAVHKITNILSEADYDGSRAKKKQIESVMNSLRKYRRKRSA